MYKSIKSSPPRREFGIELHNFGSTRSIGQSSIPQSINDDHQSITTPTNGRRKNKSKGSDGDEDEPYTLSMNVISSIAENNGEESKFI
jgi:hypothetical protein